MRRENDSWIIEDKGIASAEADAHNQRLWDIYRIYSFELNIPIILEDRHKQIHRVLPDEAIKLLEQKLERLTIA